MEKNNLVLLGLVGALGVGAYFFFKNQDQSIGGGGATGGKPGSELGSPNYFFNIEAPVFPDLNSFFNDNGTLPETTIKKDTPLIINQDDYQPGALVIVPIKNTIPNTTGGQNFPTVIPSKKETTVPYAPSPAQAPLQIQNVFGFPVVPHLSTATSTPASKKTVPIVTPSTGTKAALITTGTPAQQIEQYNIAPKIINGMKVM